MGVVGTAIEDSVYAMYFFRNFVLLVLSQQRAVHVAFVNFQAHKLWSYGAAPAYLADDCRLLSDVGRRPLRSNSNDTRKLLEPRTHNKLVGVYRPPVLDYGTTFHPDFGGRDLPSTPSDNL